MAYNSYFPQFYQPVQYQPQNMPTMPQNNAQGANNGITWVQGEAAAKSFPVGAGQSVLLMDSEASSFYIKSTDQSGMPMPLRVFDYTERKKDHVADAGIVKDVSGDYVSRAEFDQFRDDVKHALKGIRKPDINEQDGEG